MRPGPVVNLGQATMQALSSGRDILLVGSGSNTRWRMEFSPGDSGRIVLRNFRSFRYARYVLSDCDARFHGFRPQVRLTNMTPRDHTSFDAEA